MLVTGSFPTIGSMIDPPASYMFQILPNLCKATTNEESSTERLQQQRSTQKIRTIKQERKPNTIFNEVRQFAYMLRARERDDSTINYMLQFMGAIPLNV